jgi:ATP-dependent Clp protease ATP-binding subunit ClpC
MKRPKMNKRLYVYNHEKINDLKIKFSSRNFVSIALIFNLAQNLDEIDDLDDDFINKCMIDITSLALDNGYYRIFIERYLYRLIECFKSVEFLINSSNKDSILDKFPYVFDEINEEYSVVSEDCKEEDITINEIIVSPISLLLYKKSIVEDMNQKYQIISIGSLFSGAENINYKFNIDEIEDVLINKDIRYIDITELVHTLALRKDLILNFEIILRQIQNRNREIQFLIIEDMEDEIKKYFPFSFEYKKNLFSQSIENDTNICETRVFPYGSLQEIIENIDVQLKGHEDFKKDFSFNLKKFALLNKLKQRKIFSVFLTGESGIGKTEFAKILSEIMYPNQSLIKINFGNYSNEGVLNSLIGSPLGYIGSEEGGELINKMKLSNSKIILIDEFEKATPSVFHFFYELLEDGKFTDRHGIEHNLDGYIIVFTSNMSKTRYIELIPNPLKSRFDMVYRFIELSVDEKRKFINDVAKELINNIYKNTSVKIEVNNIENALNSLTGHNNLRNIKRKAEDVGIEEYCKIILDD